MASVPAPAASLTGKVLLVTGGTSGIGLATAQLFLQEGAAVAIVGTDEGRMATAIETLAEWGEVEPILADVSSFADGARAVEATVSRFGGLDYLFCNAGIPGAGLVHEIDETTWDRVIGVNLTGMFTVVRAAVPHLKARGLGAIVTTASEVGLVGYPGHSAYCASKGAVVNFTRAIALELIPYGIRVNCLAPGLTATPMSRGSDSAALEIDEVPESWASWAPIGRAAQPEEHAKAVLYLMRDATASVGSILVQDGGFSAH